MAPKTCYIQDSVKSFDLERSVRIKISGLQ